MPKQKRWKLKRQLDQAANDLERAQRNIIIVGAEFESTHQDYYDAMRGLVQGIELTRDAVINIKDLI